MIDYAPNENVSGAAGKFFLTVRQVQLILIRWGSFVPEFPQGEWGI